MKKSKEFFIPFTPHKVKIIKTKVICDVIAMRAEKTIMNHEETKVKRYNKSEDPKKTQGIVQFDPNDQDDEDYVEEETLLEIFDLYFMVLNPKTRDYEWYKRSEIRPIVGK